MKTVNPSLLLVLTVVVSPWACTNEIPPPELVAVEPGTAISGVETLITIRGEFRPRVHGNLAHPEKAEIFDNFVATLTASSSSFALIGVQRLSHDELEAVVPSHAAVGTYTLEVIDPRGQTASLTDALEVIRDPATIVGPVCFDATDCTNDPCASAGACVSGFCVYDKDSDHDGRIDAACGGDDCDDGNETVFQGATETLCDGIDQGCDGPGNDDRDADSDTITLCAGDCDDGDATRFPGNIETCDGVDNDCDDSVDNGFDQDGDLVTACGPDGIPGNADDDCDDSLATCGAACKPGEEELCDAWDNDCNGTTDDGFDEDSDGVTTCGPDGIAGNADDDCDDSLATCGAACNPGEAEMCDAWDNDCNGSIDEGFDEDSDGVTICGPDGIPGNADDDCDDSLATCGAACNPGEAEVCDAWDNNCNGTVDDGFDGDSDGVTTCGPDGIAGNADDDCDDSDPARAPGRTEECDAVDNSCSLTVDDDNACPCIALYRPGDPGRPYLFCDLPRKLDLAESLCAQLPTYELISIGDSAENDFFEQTSGAMSSQPWFLGFTDRDQEGTFTWIDGTPYTFDDFNTGEPNDAGDEDCVALANDGGWNDVVCATSARYVCEAHPENRDNTGPCLDGDGDDRGPGCALGPDCDDSDAAVFALMDGFPDDDEDGYTPASRQTRCVGDVRPSTLLDARSLEIDCDDENPTITTTCVCVTIRSPTTTYEFCKPQQPWTVARDDCRGLGLELVKIEDAAEAAFLHQAGSGYGVGYWIGLNDLQTEGIFRWVSDGSPVTFDDFHPGEPNNAGSAEHCAELVGGGWNDFDCSAQRAYICE